MTSDHTNRDTCADADADQPTRAREADSADAEQLAPTSADKFMWGEGDLIIRPAKWNLSYSPEPGHEVLVQYLDELVLYLRQKYPKKGLQEALENFLKSDVARHMPAGLRDELKEAELI